MPRPKGSKNKLVPEYYRSYFDIQVLHYPGTKTRPLHWFERLADLSSRMVYIVVPKKLPKSGKILFRKYLNNRIKPLAKKTMLSKSGKRCNDNLKAELHEFYIHVTSFYLDELSKYAGDNIRIAEIRSEIKQIHNIIIKAHDAAKKGIYADRAFFIATETDLLKPLKNIPKIKHDTDHETVRENLTSWVPFWKDNIPHIEELYYTLFVKSAFVRSNSKSYTNSDEDFNRWLEKGVNKYLFSTNDKISSPETKKQYLKHLILNKPASKSKNI